jgi:hypothetical protein
MTHLKYMKAKKLNAKLIPLDEGEDPPAELINPDYKQQPGNSRKCVECGKWHDTIVENTRTGERISEIDKCYDCFMTGAFKFQPYDGIVQLKESVTE